MSASGKSLSVSRTIDLVCALCFLISFMMSAGLTFLSNRISRSGVISSRSSALVTMPYIHDQLWRLVWDLQTWRVVEGVVQNDSMEDADVDHGSVMVVHVDLVELVQDVEPLRHESEDRVLAVQSHEVLVGQRYEELGDLLSTSELFMCGPRFAVPTSPFRLILKSVWITSLKNFFCSPSKILL